MFVKFVLEASGLWNYFPGFQVSKTKIKVIPVSNLPEKNKGVSIPPSAICYCLGFLKIAILTVIHLCEILLKRAILEIIEIFSTSKLRNYNKNFDNMKFWQPKPVTSPNFTNMKYYSKIGPEHAPHLSHNLHFLNRYTNPEYSWNQSDKVECIRNSRHHWSPRNFHLVNCSRGCHTGWLKTLF